MSISHLWRRNLFLSLSISLSFFPSFLSFYLRRLSLFLNIRLSLFLMAKTSTVFFCSFSSSPSLSRWRETNSFLPTSFRFSNRPSRFLRFSSKASDSGSFLGDDDSFGFFPWSPGENGKKKKNDPFFFPLKSCESF